jgi:hypothetical protein
VDIGLTRYGSGNKRLARSWRAVKNDRTEPVCFQEAAKQFTFTEKVLLSDEVIQCFRAHSHSQRLSTAAIITLFGFE